MKLDDKLKKHVVHPHRLQFCSATRTAPGSSESLEMRECGQPRAIRLAFPVE